MYVGKSKSLKLRLRSYRAQVLLQKTAKMMSEADNFAYIVVTSEIEALLLEARLVGLLNTPYNIQLKDDKHPLYIKITKEIYPRVLTARKIDDTKENIAFFGPFPSSTNVKHTLRTIRKIFPFAEHEPGKRICLYRQIGLCSPCPSEIESEPDKSIKTIKRRQYLKNIRHINQFLKGNFGRFIESLKRQMSDASRELDFEEAGRLKVQIEKIEYITTPRTDTESFLDNPNLIEDIRRKETSSLLNFLLDDLQIKKLKRIECFDVAHLSGSGSAASMVTFTDGWMNKDFYRHFKIRQAEKLNDVASLKEIAGRRAKNIANWGRPDLIIVDGGKGQTGVFFEVFEKLDIPVIGLAKRTETVVIPSREADKIIYKLKKVPKGPAYNLITRVRDEAHRFARRLHHRLVTRELLGI